ncbi:MAG: hypothetical protein RBT11_05955 [Desulfobacterales bacterium]|jgi:hypothetical protein|nr:hypothetical protein [Desulfobacterales bacterium]
MKGNVLVPLVIFLAILSLPLSECAATSKKQAAKEAAITESMKETWGIQITGMRLTSSGFMLDFRYRVVDAQKAAPLFDRKTKPYLIHQETGAKFIVPAPPKTGPLRSSNEPKEGYVYWMFFGNPGGYVKSGDKVTVVIGNFKAENLIVE